MTAAEALGWVRTHGVVLESGTGPVPSLAGVVADGPIRGSWWAHPRGREIFKLTRAIRDCPDVLVCRLVNGKITYVHRRLWPALVRLARLFPQAHLARVRDRHTAAGKHATEEIAFPRWVSAEIAARASDLDPDRALALLGCRLWNGEPTGPVRAARRKSRLR